MAVTRCRAEGPAAQDCGAAFDCSGWISRTLRYSSTRPCPPGWRARASPAAAPHMFFRATACGSGDGEITAPHTHQSTIWSSYDLERETLAWVFRACFAVCCFFFLRGAAVAFSVVVGGISLFPDAHPPPAHPSALVTSHRAKLPFGGPRGAECAVTAARGTWSDCPK